MLRFYRIIWVDATSAETIELSLRDVAGDPEAKAQNVGDSTESVLQWLSRRDGESLIVFDDANADIAKYIPLGNRGNVLFTSRDMALRRYVPNEAFAKVEDMDEEDAISLLLKSAYLDESLTDSRKAARPIVKELMFLPLAVDQAGASIASGLCHIDDYLQRYSQHRQELLDDPTFKGASNYDRTAYRTWNLSLTAIKAQKTEAAEAAISILQFFSFIHHENISEEIMKRAAEALKTPSDDDESQKMKNHLSYRLLQCDKDGRWDPFYFRKGIRTLLSFSLIKKAAMDNIYSMHPLVHSWSRDSMAREEQQAGSFFAHGLLSSSITFVFANEDYAFRRILVPHIKAVDRHDAELGTPMAYNDERYTNYGLVFHEAGYWKEAEQLRVQVSETRKRVLGEEHPDTLTSMAHLALTYLDQGRWEEAEQLFVQVSETRKRVVGEEHPETLASTANLASTYLNQGRWEEASLGDDKEGAWGGTSRDTDEHGKPRVNVQESGTVERGRTARGSSLGNDKEGVRGGTSRHALEHGKPRVDVQESGTVGGGRTAFCSSLGDEKVGAWGGTSIHADEHGKPRVDVQGSGAVEGGRTAFCSSLGDEKEGAWGGTSIHTDEHGKPRVDVHGSGTVE